MLQKLVLTALLISVFSFPGLARQIQSITVHKPVTPVFKNVENNPVLKLGITTKGRSDSEVTGIELDLEGTTDIDRIKTIRIFYTGDTDEFQSGKLFGEVSEFGDVSIISGEQQLKEGEHFFWISIQLNKTTKLLDDINIHVRHVLVNGKRIKPHSDRGDVRLKPAIKVRKQGQDGVDTYRIPGLVTTNSGTLIAVYDVRYDNSSDLQGDIDVGMSRSTDGGETWGPMNIIMDKGTWGGKPEAQNGVGDPAVLVDRNTGTIWVAALWTHGMPGKRAWNASQQGISPEATGQVLLVKSEDDGKTWSEPVNITRQIKKPEWHLLLQGPGKGITMSDGTLVFAAQFKDADGMPYATIMYSKDHGKHWEIGTGAKSNTTEAQVVELDNGTLMLNMRDNRGGYRSVYTTRDLGKTWSKHPTSRKALIEPVCMASLIGLSTKEGGKTSCLVFSNPASKESRINMTVKLSKDNGMSWPGENQLLLNEKRGYGYSCLTQIDENTIGILYEGIKELYFQKINLKELSVNK